MNYIEPTPDNGNSSSSSSNNSNGNSRVIVASGVKALGDDDDGELGSDSSSISSLSSSLSIPSEMSIEYTDKSAARGGKVGNGHYEHAGTVDGDRGSNDVQNEDGDDDAQDQDDNEEDDDDDDDDDDVYRGVDEVSSGDDDEDDVEHLEEQEILRTAEQNEKDYLDFDTNLDFERGVEEFALATSTATNTAALSSSIGVEWAGFEETSPDGVNGEHGNGDENHDGNAFSMDLFGLGHREQLSIAETRTNALSPTAQPQSHDVQNPFPAKRSGTEIQKPKNRNYRSPAKRRSSYDIYGDDDPFADFESDDSDDSKSDIDEFALPDFLQQDSLDPDLRRMIENDGNQAEHNGDDNVVELGGASLIENRIDDGESLYPGNDLYDLPANIYHIDSETDWDSSDLEEEFDLESDGGETTDEDYPPPPTITHPRFLLRRESSLSISTSGDDEDKENQADGGEDTEEGNKDEEEDMDIDGGDTSAKSSAGRQPQQQDQDKHQQQPPAQKRRNSRVPSKTRCGPLRGSFVADPHKPVALVAPNGVSLVLIPPYTSSRHDWLDAATEKEREINGLDLVAPDAKEYDDLASPVTQQQEVLSSGAVDCPENGQPHSDAIGENLLLKDDDAEVYDEEDDAEVSAHEEMLKIDDFFDFNSSSEKDDDEADDEIENQDESGANTSPNGKNKNSRDNQYQPSLESQQAFSNAQRLLNHFDRGVVTAFRRNHWRYQTLIRFQAPQEQVPASSSLPNRPAGVFRRTKIQQGKSSRSFSRKSIGGRVVSNGSIGRRTPSSRQVSGRI